MEKEIVNLNKNKKIESLVDVSLEKIRSLIDVNCVIGNPISMPDGTSVVPISKVSVGFVSGGGEYYSELKEMRKETEYPFSGGSGGGVSLQPIGFLVIKNGCVEVIKIDSKSAVEKLIETIPEVAKFVSNALNGNKENEK